MAKVLASPTLATCDIRERESMNLEPALRPLPSADCVFVCVCVCVCV